MAKKVTMQLIAEAAGVSKFVVSKTLNGKPGVSEATRKKILFTAKQLGYTKSRESMEEEQTEKDLREGYVLVVLPSPKYQNKNFDYWGVIFQGISDELYEKETGIVVVSSQNRFSSQINTEGLLGIITVGHIKNETLLELTEYPVPIIMVDHEDTLIQADSIFMDNQDGILKMTNYLIGLGHRRLVFVGDIHHSPSFYERWQGFRQAMEKSDPTFDSKKSLVQITYDNRFKTTFKEEVEEWLRLQEELPTGFVCANDQIASSLMDFLQKRGILVPEDCSVTGFDNLGHDLEPSLSSVQVLKEVFGKRAVDKLMWRLEHEDFPPEKVLISGEMIIRDSVASPKQATNPEKAPLP
ncbi:LacI family DNA-binding transcriptional regulator [Shouchella shacheensis]|uniref:LacI family DNA-binding transcriptional regulator n=1 Tax=Shouchella shacheensis TaxID=1649580 RepID=UPI0007401635|nr:LacI family DNA-binding transcriptional regulator [Shouchella shacheensis]